MIATGLGPLEILIVIALVLMFFGSREMPQFIRQVARLIGRIRSYSDKVRRELDSVVNPTAGDDASEEDETPKLKQAARTRFRKARAAMSEEQRGAASQALWDRLFASERYGKARAIMMYSSIGDEVITHGAIQRMLQEGKRIILPYCRIVTEELGIGEIKQFPGDTVEGKFGILEPNDSCRDNFFKSDLQLIVAPGIAFDRFGTRLGRGKRYYDSYLEDVNGRISIIGVAYSCQISPDPLPSDYHDIGMDDVLTEDGWIMESDDADDKERDSGDPDE